MEASHLDQLIQLEDSYWWHVAKRQLVTDLLKRHFPPPGILVEGGVGSGRNLAEFQELGYDVHGFDIMAASVEHANARGLANVREHDLSEPWPMAEESVKVAVMLDVLEHLAEPVRVLQHISKIVAPDGGIVLTVPAYPWLFSDWDESLGHFRRYTPALLREQASEAGLRVEWLSHWNSFSLPAAIAVRGYQRCVPAEREPDFPRTPPFVNQALMSLASYERKWLGRATAPFGLSLVGVLKK